MQLQKYQFCGRCLARNFNPGSGVTIATILDTSAYSDEPSMMNKIILSSLESIGNEGCPDCINLVKNSI